MKQLRSHDPKRQQLWQHEGHRYSIVDQAVPLSGLDATEAGRDLARMGREAVIKVHGTPHFELADVTGGGVEVLGRSESFKEAQQAITDLAAHASHKPQT
jgi:hypothetical protein